MKRVIVLVGIAGCWSAPSSDDVVGPFTGEVHRYAVDRITLPINNTAARDLGDDLNGDRRIDNQLGMVIGTLAGFGDVNKHGADIIAAGVLTSVVDIQAEDLMTDGRAGVWYRGVATDDATTLGGTLVDGAFVSNRTRDTAHAGRATVRLPILVDIDPIELELIGMELDLTPDGHGGFDGRVRGAVREAEVMETARIGLEAMLVAKPQDHRVLWSALDTNLDGTITRLEFERSDGLMAALLAADFSIDGEPVLSFGFGIHLVPAGTPPAPIADRCFDRILDGTETDLDCGSTCMDCAGGKICSAPADCQSGACIAGRCLAPTCTDGVRDGFEADIDCGGICSACGIGAVCDFPRDCASGNCVAGHCSQLPE